MSDSSPVLGEKTSKEEVEPLKKKRKKKVVGRRKSKNVEEVQAHTQEIMGQLTELSLTSNTGKELGYGYDMQSIFERGVSGENLIQKFEARWDGQKPEWFRLIKQGKTGILLLGPVPSS